MSETIGAGHRLGRLLTKSTTPTNRTNRFTSGSLSEGEPLSEGLYEGLSKTEPTTFAVKETAARNFSPGGTMPDYETGQFDTTIQEEVMRRGTTAGIWKRQNAAERRAFSGRVNRNTPEAARDRAARLDDEARLLLDPTTYGTGPVMIGTGAEVAFGTSSEASPHVDTLLKCPDMVAVDASRHRLGLARQAGGIAP